MTAGAWDPAWQGILDHLLGLDGDPFAPRVVGYLGSLNKYTAEPSETVSILRHNAYSALAAFERGEPLAREWEAWAFLELERRHEAALMAALLQERQEGPSASQVRGATGLVGLFWLLTALNHGDTTVIATAVGALSVAYFGLDTAGYVIASRKIEAHRRNHDRLEEAARSFSV